MDAILATMRRRPLSQKRFSLKSIDYIEIGVSVKSRNSLNCLLFPCAGHSKLIVSYKFISDVWSMYSVECYLCACLPIGNEVGCVLFCEIWAVSWSRNVVHEKKIISIIAATGAVISRWTVLTGDFFHSLILARKYHNSPRVFVHLPKLPAVGKMPSESWQSSFNVLAKCRGIEKNQYVISHPIFMRGISNNGIFKAFKIIFHEYCVLPAFGIGFRTSGWPKLYLSNW